MKKILFVTILLLSIASCGLTNGEDVVPIPVQEYATNYIKQLKSGNIDYCLTELPQNENNVQTKIAMEDFHNSLKNLKVENSLMISYQGQFFLDSDTGTFWKFTYEYDYDNDEWIYHTFVIREVGSNLGLESYNVDILTEPLSKINAFTFKNKEIKHFLFLLVSLIILVFTISTLYDLIRSKRKRKILWGILILLGFCKFSINWTTGITGFQPIALGFFNFAFTKSGLVAPWILYFSLPIGAIVYWVTKGRK